MDHAQFEREKGRSAAFAIASRLLHRGLITEDEYQKLTVVLTSKYRPVVCSKQNVTGDPTPQRIIGRNHCGKEV